MADCAAQACVKRKRVILSRVPDHSEITAPTIVLAATDEHTGHSSWSATWRFTHRGENEARNGDQGAERSQGVGALIQRGGRAVAGMLTIATAGGS